MKTRNSFIDISFGFDRTNQWYATQGKWVKPSKVTKRVVHFSLYLKILWMYEFSLFDWRNISQIERDLARARDISQKGKISTQREKSAEKVENEKTCLKVTQKTSRSKNL